MVMLSNKLTKDQLAEACGRPDWSVDITNLSDEKLRELPDEIAARITFDGKSLTLYAKKIVALSASEAHKISLPNLKSSDEIWAYEAEISAPQLVNGGRIVIGKHLNDTQNCTHIGTLILSADTINLRGVQSISDAQFGNATHIFLHNTTIIGSELKALKASHIAAPELEILTGHFNTSQKDLVISLSGDFVAKSGNTGPSKISPSAQINVIPVGAYASPA
jgi:hypothetical protein